MVGVRSAFRRRLTVLSLALALVVAVLPTASRADLFTADFKWITGPAGAADGAIGEVQALMEVSSDQPTDTWISFTFRNIGPERSSITDVYFYDRFEDGALSNFNTAEILSSTGVVFTEPAKPANLPGLSGYLGVSKDDLNSWRAFSADSDRPTAPNGVNNDDPSDSTPGEWLTIKFILRDVPPPADTFGEVLGDLLADRLFVGIKIQGFEDGGSEGFVNNPPRVPVPGAVFLGMLGMSAAGWRLRRFA